MVGLKMKYSTIAIAMGLAATQAAWAQSQQVYDSYYEKCVSAENKNDWKNAATFCDAAEKEAYKFGNQSYQLGDISNVIGNVLNNLGKYKDAEAYHLQALSIRERLASKYRNGPELLAESLNNLATLYSTTGRLQQAEELLRKSSAIKENIFGNDSKQFAIAQGNLALVLDKLGRRDEAETLYLKTIDIQKRKDAKSLALADSCNNLASLYSDQGMFYKAIGLYIAAGTIRDELLPANHPLLGTTYNNAGNVFLELKDYSGAASLLEESLKIRQASLPSAHPDIAQSLVNLGRAYYGLEQYEKAEKYLRDGLKRREISDGKKGERVAFTLECLSKVLRATKRDKEAIALEKRFAALRKGGSA